MEFAILFTLINQYSVQNNLPAFILGQKFSDIAQKNAQYMAGQQALSNDGVGHWIFSNFIQMRLLVKENVKRIVNIPIQIFERLKIFTNFLLGNYTIIGIGSETISTFTCVCTDTYSTVDFLTSLKPF